MKHVRRIIPVILMVLGSATGAAAVHSPSETDLEEINHHQASAASALLMGDHTLLDKGEFSFSSQVHVSGKGTDTLYGAWGLTSQYQPGERWGVGLAYGFTDAQFQTHTWLVNGQYSLVEGPEPWVRLQGGLGYQHLDSSENSNVLFFEFRDYWPVRPGNPQILLDDMHWVHGLINFQFQTRLWILRMQASFGFMYSHYSYSGWEVPTFGGLDAGLGPAISESGNSETAIWSVGLGLDLGPVRPYAGVGAFSDGGLFLARISIVF